MCISSAPSVMSGTKLYAGEAMFDDVYVHVLAYQNKARSLTSRPNAMILPFPTTVSMGPANVIDTRAAPDFLDRYAEAIQPRTRGMIPKGVRMLSYGAQVFQVGSYTVVLADDPLAIPDALEQVPVRQRPDPNDELYESFSVLYPGQPVAVCCWSGDIKPEPLLWWYEPSRPDQFFMPALDAHDGQPPRRHSVVVDHALIFGSTLTPLGNRAYFDQPLSSEMAALLPTQVQGTFYHQDMPNGDFVLPKRKFQEQRMDVIRWVPENLQ